MVADAYPATPVPARVSFIAPAVDAGRGTVDVHLDLTGEAPFLRQGMTVSVNIETARLAKALVLPNDALHDIRGNRAEVFRVVAGKVEKATVELGLRSDTQSEIRAGLQAGDAVLAADAEPGSRVRVQLQAPSAAERVDPSGLPMSGS